MTAADDVICKAQHGLLGGAIGKANQVAFGRVYQRFCSFAGITDAIIGMDKADNILKILVWQNLLLNNICNPVPFFSATVDQGMDQRQGHLAFEQVVAALFAKLALVSDIVKGIIHELECNPEIHPVRGKGFFLFRRAAAQDRSTATGRRQ